MKNQLSSDAKPFIPVFLLNYFENPALFVDFNAAKEVISVFIPPNFAKVLSVRRMYLVMDEIRMTYQRSLRVGNFQALIHHYGLYLGQFAYELSSTAAFNHMQILRYINILGLMQWMEVIELILSL